MNSSLTDRYVRNKLSVVETDEYELRLLDSPELQDELEESLILQQALKAAQADKDNHQGFGVAKSQNKSNWMQWALAASITLILVSAYFNVSTWLDTNGLRQELAALGEPRSQVIFATVKIMRSASNQVPDSIIILPNQKASVFLDIELGSRSLAAQALFFKFEKDGEPTGLSWQGSPDAKGQTMVAINSEQIPLGLVWLVVSASNGDVLERRLLEFRPSEQSPQVP